MYTVILFSRFAISEMYFQTTSLAVLASFLLDVTTAVPTASASACTISEFSQVSGCLSSTQIIVSSLQVPGGETLSLEKLRDGTTVTFTGTTTFGYKEWVRRRISLGPCKNPIPQRVPRDYFHVAYIIDGDVRSIAPER